MGHMGELAFGPTNIKFGLKILNLNVVTKHVWCLKATLFLSRWFYHGCNVGVSSP
jgi:hypothetical protein